ncbi:MAG: pilus assembly protein PilM [Phycisphaerales bacterium]
MGFSFWQRAANPIGVDFGASGVKLLQLRHGRAGLHVVAAARQDYPEDLSEDPATRHRQVVETLRAATRSAPFEGRDCVCSLSVGDLMLRATRFPKLGADELSKAAHWEAADRFNIPVEDLQVDWIRAGEVRQGEEIRDEVLLIAVRRPIVEAHLNALIECRLRPIAVDAPFAATTRCLNRALRRASDSETVRMIVDIGAAGATVMITRGQGIAFLKPVDIGGAQMNRAVAAALDLDVNAAAQLRRERMRQSAERGGELLDDRVDRALYEAVRPLLHDLAQEAALCLRYYSVTFRGVRPELVLVAGGDGAEPHMCEALSQVLKIETQVAHSLENIDTSAVELGVDRRYERCPQWSVATGLSLRDDPNEAPELEAQTDGRAAA